MADGIRIQPTAEALAQVGIVSAANRVWIVRDLSRPIAGPPYPECHRCGHHECKTYHLELEGDGTVMVSTTIWERLQTLYDCGGFEKVNVVAKPPTQGILVPTAHVKLTVNDL